MSTSVSPPQGLILPFTSHVPAIGRDARLAAGAAIIGRARIGRAVALGAYATVRADGEQIVVGDDCFFGECATLHIVDGQLPAITGDRVSAGRYALVHACTLGRNVVVGDGAVVMDGSVVGEGAIIAAGALVSPRKQLEGGWLYAGNPAVAVRPVTDEEVEEAALAVRTGQAGSGCLAHPGLLRDAVCTSSATGAEPRVHPLAYAAPTALLRGDVEVREQAGIWFGCVLDAGGASIAIGARTNIQDNSFLVTDAARGTIEIGNDVTVGHNVRLGACRIEEECLIGMGSELEDGVVVERGGVVGARAHVPAGTVVRAGHIWAGRPARPFRPVKDAEREAFRRGRQAYVAYTQAYRR